MIACCHLALSSLASFLLAPAPAPQDPTPQDPAAAAPAPARRIDPLPFERVDGGGRIRVDGIERADRVSAWLTVEVGSAHDPLDATGLSRVFAELLRAELPPPTPQQPTEVTATDRAILAGVLLAPEQVEEHLLRVARWLRGEVALDDDAILKARGRALLRADDEAAILPGPVLLGRAEQLLFPGLPAARPGGGAPEQIRATDPAAIRAAFRRTFHPSRATLVLIGAVDHAGDLAAARAALTADRDPEPVPAVAPPATGTEVVAETASDRVNAPFVMYAFPAPAWGDEGYLPFLIAMEVLRSRAAVTFRSLRGGEVRAEFPPVGYDFLRMPGAGFIARRGRDGDAVANVRAEIDSLVAGLRAGGATAPEVQSALGSLLGTLDVPPFRPELVEAMRRYPVALHQRGYVISCYGLHRWPADLPNAIGAVQLGRVDAALRGALAPERTVQVALRPDR